eukprot:Skav202585  [mRNA]  locus=scaffold1305:65778:68649:+ [translate_table: standard]
MQKLVLILIAGCCAQQPGKKPEGSPTIAVTECSSNGCSTKDHKLVLDANWRWIHNEKMKNCYTGNTWDTEGSCPDPKTCAENCILEGVNAGQYKNTYGVTAVPGGGVKLDFVTGSNVGSRLFLLEDDENYKLFNLKNREFALDVDSSTVQCGMNGAMYFVEMAANGGKGLGANNAGARFGTGYCDAQCPHETLMNFLDVKFINGQANTKDWKPHPKDFSNTMGLGHYGACCAEMDIWEANNVATAYTPHPCDIDTTGQYMCEGIECGDNDSGERYKGLCDKDGCDINPFRNGNESFYGQGLGFAVDSSRPMRVVTQFLTTNGRDDGDLSEIRRFYVQDGIAIASPPIMILPDEPDSITDEMWLEYGVKSALKDFFGNPNDFKIKGGNQAMGESLGRGHVAAFSLWDDIDVHMMWLDSCYPTDEPCTKPGVRRGTCPGGDQSSPQEVRARHPSSYVTFANVSFGEIGTTQSVYPRRPSTSSSSSTEGSTRSTSLSATSGAPTTSATTTTTAGSTASTTTITSTSACASKWKQCGGENHDGPTCCEAGLVCKYQNKEYSQCVPSDSTGSTTVPSTSSSPTTSQGGCAGEWEQCGGKNHDGPTCCKAGYFCKFQDEWYSQCMRRRSSGRQKFLGLIQSASKLNREEL